MKLFNYIRVKLKRCVGVVSILAEVIGVIKYIATSMNIPLLGLQPSVKKYAGTLDFDTIVIVDGLKPTEHTKDAYRLFYYWYRNNERGPK